MAGVKGKSGGARPGTGGARPGAGRKPKPKEPTIRVDGDDTLKLLQDIAFGRIEASSIQVRAAIAAVQYTHTKRHDGGKKEEAMEKAKNVAGRLPVVTAPKLIVSNR